MKRATTAVIAVLSGLTGAAGGAYFSGGSLYAQGFQAGYLKRVYTACITAADKTIPACVNEATAMTKILTDFETCMDSEKNAPYCSRLMRDKSSGTLPPRAIIYQITGF